MVGVIGKNAEDREAESKINLLEKITKEFLSENEKIPFRIIKNLGDIYIYPVDEPLKSIRIYPRLNLVYVNDLENFNFAYFLADRYEIKTNEPWTLKENYGK